MGTMQQLLNWSVYDIDINRFEDGWGGVARTTAELGLNGIELLISDRPTPADIPAGLVKGVHLPLWPTWLDVWRDIEGAVDRYFPQGSPELVRYLAGGYDSAEMVTHLAKLWSIAAETEADYAVWHVSHAEAAHTVTRAFTYSDEQVVDSLAELMNRTAARFHNGEPPIQIAFENVWWPGLTFTRPEIARRLADRLNFDNWGFVLDTAHLIHNNRSLRSEGEAIDYVLERLSRLEPDLIDRIDVMHLNFGLTGEVQDRLIEAGLPAEFDEWGIDKRLAFTRPTIYATDPHLPFRSPRCAEIVASVKPKFLVHEFTSGDMDELYAKCIPQLEAFQQGEKELLNQKGSEKK